MSRLHRLLTQTFQARKAMPGDLVPFPISRHGRDGVSFVEAVASRMLELSPPSAERHLACQLDRKALTLRRRGFDAAIVKAETNRAEAAIGALLLRTVFEGGAG